MANNCFTVEVTPAKQVIQKATVLSWLPLVVHVNVWHPLLGHYMRLVQTKLVRGEDDAAEFNSSEFVNLTDQLVIVALREIIRGITRWQRLINRVVAIGIMACTVIYTWLPFAAGITAVAVVSMLFSFYWALERYLSAINAYIIALSDSAELRIASFQQSQADSHKKMELHHV